MKQFLSFFIVLCTCLYVHLYAATGTQWTQMMQAINTGDLKTVQAFITTGTFTPTDETKGKRTLLNVAYDAKQMDVFAYLRNSTPHLASSSEWTAIMDAIANDNDSIVKTLVASKSPYGVPLFWPTDLTKGKTTLLQKASGKPKVLAYFQSLLGKITTPEETKESVIRFYRPYDPYFEFTNFWPYYDNTKIWQTKTGFTIDGKIWPTTEHYFQTQKYEGPNQDTFFTLTKNMVPLDAMQKTRDTGPTVNWKTAVRADWFPAIDKTWYESFGLQTIITPAITWYDQSGAYKVKNSISFNDLVMYKALVAKFTQYADLRKLLLATGDAKIIEASDKDWYWGEGSDRHGLNMLGRFLMFIREQIASGTLPSIEHIILPNSTQSSSKKPAIKIPQSDMIKLTGSLQTLKTNLSSLSKNLEAVGASI